MSTVVATVHHGRIGLDEPTDLPEGTVVQLYIVDEGDDLDDAERGALDDALEAAATSVAGGEKIPADDVMRWLDANA